MRKLRALRERATGEAAHDRDLRGLDTSHIDKHFFGSIVLTVTGHVLPQGAVDELNRLGAAQHPSSAGKLTHFMGSRSGKENFRNDSIDFYAWSLRQAEQLKDSHQVSIWEARTFHWAMLKAIHHAPVETTAPIAHLAPKDLCLLSDYLHLQEAVRFHLKLAGCSQISEVSGFSTHSSAECIDLLKTENAKVQIGAVQLRKAA